MEFYDPEDYWMNLLVIAGAIIFALVLHFLIFRSLRLTGVLSKRERLKTLQEQLYSPTRILLVIICILLVYPAVHGLLGPMSGIIRHILSIILIITSAWLLIKLIRTGRIILMRKYDLEAKNNYEARKAYTQFRMIENILIFLVAVVTIGVVLMTFEAVREIGVSILTSAGIAGIILGFAAQKLIATILAGIQIAITQPISIEDVVIVENEWGRIEEITLTYVVVRIWDERRLIVPTTYFIENTFQNWTRRSSQILGTIYIYTDYHVPMKAIRDELTRLLESTEKWDKRVNVLQVTDAKERTVELRALVSASDSSTAWDLRVFIRENLILFLQENYPEALPRTRINIEKEPEKIAGDYQPKEEKPI